MSARPALGRVERERVLRELGADEADLPSLLQYTESPYATAAKAPLRLPLDEEPHVAVWRDYAAAAELDGAEVVLRRVFVQLRFPIDAGIADSEAYRAATRRGDLSAAALSSGCQLVAPEGIRIVIHESPAGAIPLIIIPERADFVTLVRALTARNAPEPVPESLGALSVGGYNNWDRIGRHRAAWEAAGVAGDWRDGFRRLIPRKELYQDRFVLLSTGPYSGVAAATLGLDPGEWPALSTTIRAEHEATHYFTRRVFGAVRSNLFDELVADTMGVLAAAGRFREDWLLHFMGLADYPAYRAGARLENYLGDPPLSASARTIVRDLVHAAILNLARFDARLPGRAWDPAGRTRLLVALCRFDLVDLAAPDAAERLHEEYGGIEIQPGSVAEGDSFR